MNVVLEQILQTGTATSESGVTHRIRSHVPIDEGLFLRQIVAETKPTVSLEIGLAYGISTLFVCEALATQPSAHHIVIDPHQFEATEIHKEHDVYDGIGLYNLKKAGYEKIIEFRGEPSQLALPRLVSEGVRVDFAFIDGWHTFDFALVDFFYVDRLLRPGGVVVLDDTDFASVWKLCRYIASNRAYRVIRCLPSKQLPTARLPVRMAVKGLRSGWRWLRGLVTSDGLVPNSRCIAFRKEADDSRGWDFHRSF